MGRGKERDIRRDRNKTKSGRGVASMVTVEDNSPSRRPSRRFFRNPRSHFPGRPRDNPPPPASSGTHSHHPTLPCVRPGSSQPAASEDGQHRARSSQPDALSRVQARKPPHAPLHGACSRQGPARRTTLCDAPLSNRDLLARPRARRRDLGLTTRAVWHVGSSDRPRRLRQPRRDVQPP